MAWPADSSTWLNPWPIKYLLPANKWLPICYPPEPWQMEASSPAFDEFGNPLPKLPPLGQPVYWWLLPRETWPYRDEMPWEDKVFGAWPASQVTMSEDLPPYSGNFPNTPAGHEAWARTVAKKYGLNPDLFAGIGGAEGNNKTGWSRPGQGSSVDVDSQGHPFSFGDYQFNMHQGALGDKMLKESGIDARDPKQWQKATDWAARYIKTHGNKGLQPWIGDPVARGWGGKSVYGPGGSATSGVAAQPSSYTGGMVDTDFFKSRASSEVSQINGLNPEFADDLKRATTAAEAVTGQKAAFTSLVRSKEKQAELYYSWNAPYWWPRHSSGSRNIIA